MECIRQPFQLIAFRVTNTFATLNFSAYTTFP